MVRTEVHHKVVGIKQTVLGLDEFAKLIEIPLRCPVALRFIGHREAVVLRTHIEILTKRITFEIITKEETAHIGMTQELNTKEIEHLALKQICVMP